MLPLGHIGIPVGLALAGEAAARRLLRGRVPGVDLRFLALGSVLPDLVDKPLAFTVPALEGATRAFGHSLLFSLGLTAVTLLLARRRGWLWVAVGCWAHLALDGMWALPEVLLWPGLGWGFPRLAGPDLLAYLRAFLQDPLGHLGSMAGEVLGGAVIAGLLAHQWRRGRLGSLWRTGLARP